MSRWLKKKKSPSKKLTSPEPAATELPDFVELLQEQEDYPEDITVRRDNTSGDSTASSSSKSPQKKKKKRGLEVVMETRLKQCEAELARAKEQIQDEKAGKRKLYSSLVKLANQLKKVQREQDPLLAAANYANQTWYEGGMWRAPQVLPGVAANETKNQQTTAVNTRQPISLSELFFDLVIVMAFTRVGTSVSTRFKVDWPVLAYFAIFWIIWSKEASYSTRFDTTDLSAQAETLLTCFAVLFGSLSTSDDFNSEDSSRMMMVAGFVAVLHFFLHVRVAFWYKSAAFGSAEEHVRNYAMYNVVMNMLEAVVWWIGVFFVPLDSTHRWLVFFVGILLAQRLPRAFLANDFHGACSKRAVLFILLLGFLLQSVVVEASPFFDYQSPSVEQYAFLGSSCLLLFCIKLLYVEDSNTMEQDHALLINRWAGFFFHIGQFCLLLATTVLGSGLDLLTHSYLAATAALPNNAKNLTCGGFSAVVLSIAFIKSMHLRRFPLDPKQKFMFVMAFIIQMVVLAAAVITTAWMCFTDKEQGVLSYLMVNEIEMMFVLCAFAFCLVITQWLDEAVELSLYETGKDSRHYLVHPFGIWWCLKTEVPLDEADKAAQSIRGSISHDKRLSALSPLLGSSVANLRLSQLNLNYDAVSDDVEKG